METLSLKLPKSLGAKLATTARRRGTSKSTIVREALEGYLAADGEALPASFAAQAKEFIGCLDGGPADLASNKKHLKGFGK
jgi:predicted DNA-binding protein